jgi:hypothetical protein
MKRIALFASLQAALAIGVTMLPASLATAGSGKGTQYAFLVGCGEYNKSEFHRLPYTGNDVEGFRQALVETGSSTATTL